MVDLMSHVAVPIATAPSRVVLLLGLINITGKRHNTMCGSPPRHARTICDRRRAAAGSIAKAVKVARMCADRVILRGVIKRPSKRGSCQN